MKKTLCLIALIAALTLTFCVAALAEATVTDGMNRSVLIAKTPEKVISLTPANTEILFALGVGDKLIGVDNMSNYPPEVSEVSNIVGDYSGPNMELIVSLMPDVVFASTKLQVELIDRLEEMGITVVCNDPTSFEGISQGIQLIADTMGADASALLKALAEAEAKVKADAEGREAQTAYYALSFGEYGNWSAGPGTFIDDMIKMAGGVNVAASSPVAWPLYTMEQLMIDDPDILLVSVTGGDLSVIDQIKQAEGYKDLRCVQEGKVYPIDADISSRPGPRIGEALTEIGAIFGQ